MTVSEAVDFSVTINPLAIFREDNGVITVETSSSEPGLQFDAVQLLRALAHLNGQPRSVVDLFAQWRGDDFLNEDPEEILESLLACRVLVPAGTSGEIIPSVYHSATRDHPFLDMAEPGSRRTDNRLMDSYAQVDEYPGVFLDVQYESEVRLEDAAHLEMPQLWSDPRQCLALLISGTFGARRHLAPYVDPVSGYRQLELLFKSVPSGGSRHPTECFLAVLRSHWLTPGLYHFDPDKSRLGRLPQLLEPIRCALSRRLGDPDVDASEAIYVVLGSVADRSMFRYRDARSFRALLVDVGHADAQLAALAAYCNWKYTSGVTVDIEELPRLVGLDPARMPVLHTGLLQAW